MASPLTSIGKAPVWQIVAGGVLASALITAGWFFLYYEEASQQNEQAKVALDSANAELETMQKKQANYEQERQKLQEAEEEIAQMIREIPSTKATVDHLMKPFQRQARLVGFEIESWAPGAEQRFDYYAKTPVEIHASGTWHQAAEFFRKVSEMTQVVNIEEVRLKSGAQQRGPGDTAVYLTVDFTAASFRFLPEAAGATQPASRRTGGAEGAPAGDGGAPGATGAPAQPAPETKEG